MFGRSPWRAFAKGQPVAIICPNARDFVVAIAGCFYGGAIAVPVPAVATRRSASESKSIVEASNPKAILANAEILAQPWIAALTMNGMIDAIELDKGPQSDLVGSASLPGPSSPALMQFTSGSTGAPRGVLLSHANIAANCAAIAEAYSLQSHSRGFSWLPLHHDMGLVGHVLTTLWVGGRSTIMVLLLRSDNHLCGGCAMQARNVQPSQALPILLTSCVLRRGSA